jgi:hypothetical protein
MPTTYTEITAGTATITTLIVDNSAACEPTPTTSGTFGQIIICENYIYVYDGSRWKRGELTTYTT